jgi:hypothetical protein
LALSLNMTALKERVLRYADSFARWPIANLLL